MKVDIRKKLIESGKALLIKNTLVTIIKKKLIERVSVFIYFVYVVVTIMCVNRYHRTKNVLYIIYMIHKYRVNYTLIYVIVGCRSFMNLKSLSTFIYFATAPVLNVVSNETYSTRRREQQQMCIRDRI